MLASTETSDTPAAKGDWDAETWVQFEKLAFVPKQKETEVNRFCGLTNPLNDAVVLVIELA
jgi:hypothetical protein